jgi:hypothetical protein
VQNYSNQKFDHTEVDLDTALFDGCEFSDCVMVYSGGPTQLTSCTYRNCSWRFDGIAGRVLAFLQCLDPAVIKGTFEGLTPNGDINVM